MTIEKNDPRLTAFVLGELPDDEAKEIQAVLDADAELREEVEAIRKTVTEIEEFMKSEPVPGEAKISTPGVIDKQAKKRPWYRPTWIEVCCLIGIVGVCISLLMPPQQAARHAARRLAEQSKVADTEMDGLPSAAIPESEPIADYRYNSSDEKRRERHDEFARNLMEAEASFVPVPDESTQRGRKEIGRREWMESPSPVNPKLPAEKSEKKDEAPKMEVATADMGDLMAPEALMSSMGEGPETKRSAVPGRPRSKSEVRGSRSAPSPAPEERGAVTMLVTPRIIVQEEEEEYLTGIRDDEGKPADSKKYMSVKVYPLADLVTDPYNSANDESYKNFVENDFLRSQKAPFSTFSIDVDTAAYTTMRRYINQGQRPPAVSVRLEEYVNFFKYDYAQPTDGKPFATHVDVAPCPWEPKHLLARIGIKGKEYTVDERPPLNLVFLIDTSGSMSSSNRLPLVQRGLTELVEMLQPKDRVAIVTYAGSSKVALPSVSGQEKQAILDSINSLNAGGSTAGAQGIKTAYETARKYYNKNAQNRVILCTDGDFNVGETNNKTLEQMIGEEAKSGVFLTILGFGMGNYKDERLKTLSMRGNGNYGYIDTIDEARRLLAEGLTGTLFAIAKDVKIQVDFNPARVAAYRLLGYENRKLRDEDFHNDKIDAGEIGAGHTVTALYEIVPVGGTVPSKVDESRYADKESIETPIKHEGEKSKEIMFVKLRYKQPDGDKSSLLEYPVVYNADAELSGDAEFAAAVALYGMLLRQSQYSGDATFDAVLELAEPNVKDDPYRKEFVELVRKAKELR